MKYAVVIERAEDGGYGAYVPDLPGCIAVAETVDEVTTLIRDAIAAHIEQLRAAGDPMAEPTSQIEYVDA